MKNNIAKFFLLISLSSVLGCADNSFDEYPMDDNFPLQLVLDSEEGADLPDAEDASVEIQLADFLPGSKLPATPISLNYTITDLEGDMVGNVLLDKVVYEVEMDDCMYEREFDFQSGGDGLTGTIYIVPDAELGSIPESFEVIFTLPGLDETEGQFKVIFSNLQSSENIILGFPREFKYEVLDNDVAGEWETEIASNDAFENFKAIFGPINSELQELSFEDITGKVKAEFEFEEMKFILELTETSEIVSCEDGETETEIVNKEIEIEVEYDADEGEIEFEGSHLIANDEGLVEDELDFIIEATYMLNDDESATITFFSVVDEDHFSEGEELFRSEPGFSFTFEKD